MYRFHINLPIPPTGTIVVVDDDIQVLDLMVDLVCDLGFHAEAFTNTDDALMFILQGDISVLLVLTDIRMPGRLNGVALARMLTARQPGLPVIVTTGYADEIRDLPTGVTFVPKPWPMDVVRDLVLRLTAGQPLATTSASRPCRFA